MAQCGNCGKEMKEDAIFCEHCGSAALLVTANDATGKAPDFYSSPPVEEDSDTQEIVAHDEKLPAKKRSLTPLIVVLCVLLVVALVAVGLLLKNKAPASFVQGSTAQTTQEWTPFTTTTPMAAVLAYPAGINESLLRVDDGAGLLSKATAKDLGAQAKAMAQQYHMDIVIVTRRGLGGKSPMEYADDHFDYGGYGWREEETNDITTGSGILLLLNMVGPGNNDIWISTKGEGMSVFNDGVLDYLIEAIKPELINGNYAAAMKHFLDEAQGYLENDPILAQGKALYESGNYAQALIALDQAIEARPDSGTAYSYRGLTQFSLGSYQAAITDFTQAMRYIGENTELMTLRGTAFYMQALYLEAIGDLTRAIEINPGNVNAYTYRAMAYEATGRMDLASADRARVGQ